MDTVPLLQIVDRLVKAVDSAEEAFGHRNRDGYDYGSARADVIRLLPAARRITAHVRGAPGPDDFELVDPSEGWELNDIRDAALRLQGALQTMQLLDTVLGVQPPAIQQESIHPWVWQVAETLWNDGHKRHALHAAAEQIDTQTQAKLGVQNVSGTSLMQEAFSVDPPKPSKPRLRFSGIERESKQFKSVQQGAGMMAAGVFMLIRNGATHRVNRTLDDDVAIEQLACLSYVARLVDFADVERAPDDETPTPTGSDLL
jgi:hypothetical protein